MRMSNVEQGISNDQVNENNEQGILNGEGG
jgi:hypothetical protein